MADVKFESLEEIYENLSDIKSRAAKDQIVVGYLDATRIILYHKLVEFEESSRDRST